ncbi:MAG: 50S ribosomal protein L21 [Candidatus Poribacteria bacterium]
MYAIFETGGKQYKASAGDIINIEKTDISEDGKVELKDVLMLVDDDRVEIGKPNLENASIVGHLIEYVKGKKIIVFKSKRRKGYHRKIGHRQTYMKIQIDEIRTGNEPVVEVQDNVEEVTSNGA